MGLNKRLIDQAGAAGGGAVVNTDNFAPILYSGDGTSSRSISVGFDPDLVWIKPRNYAESHALFDSTRPAGERIVTNDSGGALQLSPATAELSTNSFIVSTTSYNDSSRNYVAYCWKGGGSSNTFNIDGTGYSTASAAGLSISTGSLLGASVNSSAGFGIYEVDPGNNTNDANTITHQLGGEPELIITKRTASTGNWYTYHKDMDYLYSQPNKSFIFLNAVSAANVGGTATIWGTSATTFSAYTDQSVYSDSTIMYAFRSVEGFSKIGTYTGNGGTQTIDVGFTPRFAMLKGASFGSNWEIVDSARGNQNLLLANLNIAESTNAIFPSLSSSGIELNAQSNNSGATFVYIAFA